ncbi:MAG: SIS domain-containing protein [Candidatus Omnitrophica bacterium]|nr:SIS domain-containing protein [Candidatus Omnitrophota bacterium]
MRSQKFSLVNRKKSRDRLREILLESIRTKEALLSDAMLQCILSASERITHSFRRGGKLILYGNGGSASDSLHIAGEFLGRFSHDIKRPSLPAVALSGNPASLTAISNDFGYLYSFARELEGLANPTDVAVGISTSGNSPNVLEATKMAKKKRLYTIGLTGGTGGKLKSLVDLCILVPSSNTQRIQESHITIGHAICELVEKALYG